MGKLVGLPHIQCRVGAPCSTTRSQGKLLPSSPYCCSSPNLATLICASNIVSSDLRGPCEADCRFATPIHLPSALFVLCSTTAQTSLGWLAQDVVQVSQYMSVHWPPQLQQRHKCSVCGSPGPHKLAKLPGRIAFLMLD